MKRATLALLILAAAAVAAPVPTTPPEVLTHYKTLQEFEADTAERGGKVLRYEDLSKGTRTVYERGWVAHYFTDAGRMFLSNAPDGRLRYGYFDHETGAAIDYNGKPAPAACVGCHNKDRAR
jgi:cytochrome c553